MVISRDRLIDDALRPLPTSASRWTRRPVRHLREMRPCRTRSSADVEHNEPGVGSASGQKRLCAQERTSDEQPDS